MENTLHLIFPVPKIIYYLFFRNFSILSTSSSSYATISNSRTSLLEKIFAIDTYCASFDFKFSRSPSPVINSTFPTQLSTTLKSSQDLKFSLLSSPVFPSMFSFRIFLNIIIIQYFYRITILFSRISIFPSFKRRPTARLNAFLLKPNSF